MGRSLSLKYLMKCFYLMFIDKEFTMGQNAESTQPFFVYSKRPLSDFKFHQKPSFDVASWGKCINWRYVLKNIGV